MSGAKILFTFPHRYLSSLESEEADSPLEFEDTCEDHLPEAVIDRQETARLMRSPAPFLHI